MLLIRLLSYARGLRGKLSVFSLEVNDSQKFGLTCHSILILICILTLISVCYLCPQTGAGPFFHTFGNADKNGRF